MINLKVANNIENAVVCFTDGNAPKKNSKEGKMIGTVGWGFVKLSIRNGSFIGEEEYYGKIENATVDMAEMQAIIEALGSYLPAVKNGTILPLYIVCDRQNIVKGFNEWIDGWKKRGWRNSSGKPVANLSFWKKADKLWNELMDFGIEVTFIHMRGHRRGSDPTWMQDQNEKADDLAQKGRSGIKDSTCTIQKINEGV